MFCWKLMADVEGYVFMFSCISVFEFIKVFVRKAGGLFPKAGDVSPEGGGLFPDLSFCVEKNIREYFLFCGVSFPEDDGYGAIGRGLDAESCIILQDFLFCALIWPAVLI